MKQVLLTGDRPSGKLHLGHYVGSLLSRVTMQDQYDSYIMVADVQALTDNFENPGLVQKNIYEVASDYLAVGIDPNLATIYIQSQIPEITELTIYFMNLVSLSRLERNPTVKAELTQKGMTESIPVGFLCYPINQAADIAVFLGEIIPAGEDQQPMIEQTNEIVRRFNRIYDVELLKECQAHIGLNGRLPGIDGKNKASKSLGNAIFLSDDTESIRNKVKDMYTDPNHLKVSDKGQVEGNVVFTYLDAFHNDKDELVELKEHYKRGGLGDVPLKALLFNDLEALISPIRDKRATLSHKFIKEVLLDGTSRARTKAQETMRQVRAAMGLNHFT
ncbi:MAG: tryptophan--tRNA ligase [Holosporales bacterium]|jgi:tryptophanyl-tRNA synthetase|nr:tryptophan--tRNA ligase [Holosporales bacterium]